MTVLGYIIIPITIFLLLFRSKYLLAFALISSIFSAATVINLEGDFSLGISVYYWCLILISIRLVFLLILGGKILLSHQTSASIKLFGAFTAFAFMSSFILPVLFSGMQVYVPRLGIDGQLDNLSPLKWGFSNFGQAIYSVLNLNLLIFTAYSFQTQKDIIYFEKIFKFSFFLFCFIGLWQMISNFSDFPFPSELIYSNPTYYKGFEQTIGSFPRINSTFSEPSNAGMYLVAAFAGFYYMWIKKFNRSTFYLLTSLFFLILTTSSTAYFMLSVVILISFLNFFLNLSKLKSFNFDSIVKLVLLSGAIFAFLGAAVVNFGYLLSDVTFNKLSTGSFLVRFSSDIVALQIFSDTFGLGVGLGSNRPSSFLTYLLSNVGLLGSLLLFAALIYLIHSALNKKSVTVNRFAIIFVIFLLSKIVSGPDLNEGIFWSLAAYVLGMLNANSITHPINRSFMSYSDINKG